MAFEGWLRSLRRVALTAATLFAAELLVVVIAQWGVFVSLWEIQWGALWLAPIGLLLLASAVALCWPWSRALLGRGSSSRWAAALVLGAFAGTVAFGVSQGRHFDLWWRRAGFVVVVASAVGYACYASTPRLRGWASQHRRMFMVVCGALAIAFELGNHFVLRRLYPAFHLGLALSTVGSFTLAASIAFATEQSDPDGERRGRGRSLRSPQLLLPPILTVAAAALLLPAAQRLSRFDNFRWVLLENAPLLGQVVRVASHWSPPLPLSPAAETTEHDPSSARSLDFEGRDLLLITVDALRADHVGSYGYDRDTTPNIDALAAQGARFEYAYCATPHTSYSLTSLFTGKYIRPLLLQGVGQDSDTWATLLRTYGYRTAAFYPPAVFFIDRERFAQMEQSGLGFEYRKREFLEGMPRVQQVNGYLEQQPTEHRVFVWVHFFGPHEPYEKQPGFDFGDKDVDRYDSEIAFVDSAIGELVQNFRNQRPDGVVMVSSDHGEEFYEHGGRYHGSSVYEEQARVPLVISAPGAISPSVVHPPVQTIDLLPTVLRALDIPVRPRLRGRDLGPLIHGADGKAQDPGFAYAETDEQAMLAHGSLRLLCQRKVGACRLFDVSHDPLQQRDIASEKPAEMESLRQRLQALNASHGRFERQGLRAEGKGWPQPILRGIAGDGDAAVEIAELLDDADVSIRRKAAETLFRLRNPDTAPSLRLALARDEDSEVQRYAAVTLTRLGEGASLTTELVKDPDVKWRRRAALALAEAGDDRGLSQLIAWWMSGDRTHAESEELLDAFAKVRAKQVVGPLLMSLDDVRLRAKIAQTLAEIGDDAARGRLALALRDEPYQTTRSALANALLQLDADNELVVPLRRWLGVPDPIADGLHIATQAGVLEHLGGPNKTELARLRRNAQLGELVRIVVPKTGNGQGVRVMVRATNTASEPASVWVGKPYGMFQYDLKGKLTKSRKVPEIHPNQRLELKFPADGKAHEVHAIAPASLELQPGRASYVVVLAARGVEIESVVALPLQDELSPHTPGAAENPPQSSRQAGNSGAKQ